MRGMERNEDPGDGKQVVREGLIENLTFKRGLKGKEGGLQISGG